MKLRVGVVPEHFSSPVFIYDQQGKLQAHGVDVEVVICEAGTGDMVKRLQKGDLDLAFCVTEGLTTAVANDPQPIRMVGTYVTSPLCWSVSTGFHSAHQGLDTLRNGTIGISRFGSGSHIMALYMADQHQWPKICPVETAGAGTNDTQGRQGLQFRVLHNLPGLAQAAEKGEVDAFLWEVFTTKHLYKSQQLRPIGQVIPPWSSFSIGARVHQLLDNPEGQLAVRRFLEVLNEAVQEFLAGMTQETKDNGEGEALPPSLRFLMERFHYSQADALAWFKTVRYPSDVRNISRQELGQCVHILRNAGAIHNSDRTEDDLIDPQVTQWV
ncbi:hypothetical protein IWQ61_004612 [Dispira simplex]|nr:hypothetical protein IWQ61_004612 [Dispira simplex]